MVSIAELAHDMMQSPKGLEVIHATGHVEEALTEIIPHLPIKVTPGAKGPDVL